MGETKRKPPFSRSEMRALRRAGADHLLPPSPQMTDAEAAEFAALDESEQDPWLRAWMARNAPEVLRELDGGVGDV